MQISFPVIFDPRFKLAFIDFRLKQAFGSAAEAKIATLKKVLLELFKDYSQVSTGGQDLMEQQIPAPQVVPSELEAYLTKPPIPRSETFDILTWWKSNSVEYPTLSRMAHDVLVVPASTVASESAFSTGRRIISDFRSRLTPKTVEALICLQDWIRASGTLSFQLLALYDLE